MNQVTYDIRESGDAKKQGRKSADTSTARAESPTLTRPAGMERPEPDWVRGVCPECGEELVSNMYYTGGRGYLIVWECWASLGETPSCGYRRVL